jgi:hypothetical protein
VILRGVLLFFAFSVLLLMSMISLTSASPHVGVSAGDWFKYKVVRGGNGNTAWMGDFEFDDYIRVEVVSVNGTQVGLLETHWPSQFSDSGVYNATGAVDLSKDGGEFHLAYAGLAVGDTVPAENWLDVTNGTFLVSRQATRIYCGENRTVCMANISYSKPYDLDILDIYEEFWWDQETGILVEKTFQTTVRGYENSLSFAGFLLVENSLWGDHPSSSLLSPAIFLAVSWGAVSAAAVASVLVVHNVKKRSENGKS